MADWRSYFSGRYLSGPVLTQDTTATVDHVESTLVEDPEGGEARERMIVHFRDNALKPWLPCKTTGFCMAAMYGDDTDGWAGKPVTLFFDPTVRVGRDVKGGIRVRGAPGIRPMTVEIKLPKRKPASVRLVDTAPQRQSSQREPGRQPDRPQQPARPTLAEVLTGAGLTMADLDRWAVEQGKPAASSLPAPKQQATAEWLTADPSRLEALRPAAPVAAPSGQLGLGGLAPAEPVDDAPDELDDDDPDRF